MNPVLDGLKERLENARVRHAEAARVQQAALAEVNNAAAEFNIWHNAYNFELKAQEARDKLEAEEKAKQAILPGTLVAQESDAPQPQETSEPETGALQETVNKTDLVRDVLRAHPTGMTPPEIWKALKEQITSRAYLYSILKRLKDREEIAPRRGKYLLKPKPLETKSEMVEGNIVVQ